MSTNTTGPANVSLIPEGAKIDRAYYAIPDAGGIGPKFTDQDAALRTAINSKQAAVDKHNAHYPVAEQRVPLPERITIDYRWKMTYPDGGGIDFPISQATYDTIADAQAHLDRIERFATV